MALEHKRKTNIMDILEYNNLTRKKIDCRNMYFGKNEKKNSCFILVMSIGSDNFIYFTYILHEWKSIRGVVAMKEILLHHCGLCVSPCSEE